MLVQHLILGGLWAFYGFFHSLLASVFVKNKAKQLMGHSFIHYRLFYTLFAFVTLVLVIYYQVSIPALVLWEGNIVTKAAGIMIGSAGLVLMWICIRNYFMSLSGIRSLVQETYAYPELIIKGVHRYLRHPLYLGTFGAIWGLFIFLPLSSLLVGNCVITAYTLLAIPFEERKLLEEFGDQYSNYRSQVPRLLPSRKAYKEGAGAGKQAFTD